MAKEPNLKQRVAILEERLKLYEPPPAHKVALADKTAELRCAEHHLQRLQRGTWIFTAAMAASVVTLEVVRALR